jgi:hypothetical protein
MSNRKIADSHRTKLSGQRISLSLAFITAGQNGDLIQLFGTLGQRRLWLRTTAAETATTFIASCWRSRTTRIRLTRPDAAEAGNNERQQDKQNRRRVRLFCGRRFVTHGFAVSDVCQ